MGKTISCSVLLALISCYTDVIISQSGVFRLGFFSFANSSNRYVGILYHQIPVQTMVWVANRNKPLKDSSRILKISDDGNLVVLNGKAEILWSSKVKNLVPNATTAQLLDSGNLVLNNGVNSLWESFEDPSNAFLETMKISTDVKKGRKVKIKSWKSPDDPSDGNFSLSLEYFNIPEGASLEYFNIPEGAIWDNNQLYYRSGPWNGQKFIGVKIMHTVYLVTFYLVSDDKHQTYYVTYQYSNNSWLLYYELDSQGKLSERYWDAGEGDNCDVYGKCGPFGMCCDPTKRPICSCLKGFKPRNREEWSRGNWSSGCFRTTLLQCQRDNNNGSEAGQGDDGFLKLKMMKVPAFPDLSSDVTYSECKDQCLKNCSCLAYAHDDGIGCMFWGRDLIDVQKFSTSGVDLYIRLPSSKLDKVKSNKVIVITTVIGGIVVIAISALFLWCRMAKQRGRNKIWRQIEDVEENLIGAKLQQLPLFNFEELATVTDNFHHIIKLGQGGFGPVYRGTLDDGKEISVKRLSKASGQGLEEFKNEVVVISKLQHRNLVKLFGCCVEGEEKMLVYEYMPNKSLDSFLFG
ncbi:hypothetical protein ES319_D01G031300v1 [Gossypium barbadense]|uniref:non-specific serine/threonine protein kinase n=1 Tax=Gossypium barbadense TaxID=3634 RepID=A0A5J5SJR5_GOSBA|nr:hypothetical protein ES319_D01G031300v1 [Gossypium barbadense]